MKGLELSKLYYETFGKKMIIQNFQEIEHKIAIGLVGEGSECLGYDDDISTDHDFEPGFCIFLTNEDYDKYGFRLQRAYNDLPKEFMNYRRSLLNPVGGARKGVISISDFYKKFLGYDTPPDTIEKWLYTPSQMFKTSTNGKIFRDDLGIFSNIRNIILNGYPEDIRLKKIAANTIFAAQSGQYNYQRIAKRNDIGACILCLNDWTTKIISIVHLLNNQYEPFYKWVFRSLKDLHILNEIDSLLLSIDYSIKMNHTKNIEVIEQIAYMIISEFKNQNISSATCNNLDTHAYSILDHIKDNNLRNMNIMAGL